MIFIDYFNIVLKDLKKPDNQGRNWYLWTCNQLSHTLIGLLIFSSLEFISNDVEFSIFLSMLFMLIKELFDCPRSNKMLIDGVFDIIFFTFGIVLSISLSMNSPKLFFICVSATFTTLSFGIYSRIKRKYHGN